MKKLVAALVFLLCGISTISKSQTAQDIHNANEEDRDFLFLGAEEPDEHEPQAQSTTSKFIESDKITPPDEEENVVVVPSKKDPKKKRIVFEQKKEYVTREQITPVHDKLEDEVIPQPSPYFAMRKKFGEFTLSGKFRPEAFFGKNLNFLNNCHDLDRVLFVRQTIDLNGLAKFWSVPFDEQKKGNESVIFKFTLRDKAVWGNPASIAPTSDSPIRTLDVTYGEHRHFIGRNIVWIREVWCKASLNKVFGSTNERQHWFTIGYYPFQVGHGIALGDAYAVNPGLLGFFTENTVDQYAPGILFSGEIIKDRFTYDLYGAMFENKSDSLSNNAERIYEQKFGATWPFNKGRTNQSRGFGHVNWLVALKFESVAMDSKRLGKLEIEPYILYNHAPEQRIEFPADSYSKLGTAGFDIDYQRNGFEASFEFAGNFGHQVVDGWDRNRIIHQLNSTTAAITEVNSKVIDTSISNNALFTSANQTAINASYQDEDQNGQAIPGTTLVNAKDRFSNPYINEYKGWMVVFDTGCWFFDKQLQVAGTFGVATGDENPNANFEDPKSAPVNSTPSQPGKHCFKGFVGLQEIFSGERVESVYVLGQRKLKRPLSLPNDAVENGFAAATVSEFTNLIYFGTGLHIKPNWKNKFYCRPNLLFYWQQKPSRAFNLSTAQESTTTNARNYLGAEINMFVDLFPLEDLKATLVASYFVPGTHYDDIKGTPVEPGQIKILQQIDDETDPIVLSSLPLLGTNTAFSFNFALEYRY